MSEMASETDTSNAAAGTGNAVNSASAQASQTPLQPIGAQPHSVPVPARRVGTVTMGIALIATGILLCVSMFYPSLEVWMMFRFAPLLLVLLGVEILVSHARAKGKAFKYDGLSMVVCSIIILFAMGVTSVTAAFLYETGFYGSEHTGGYHYRF